MTSANPEPAGMVFFLFSSSPPCAHLISSCVESRTIDKYTPDRSNHIELGFGRGGVLAALGYWGLLAPASSRRAIQEEQAARDEGEEDNRATGLTKAEETRAGAAIVGATAPATPAAANTVKAASAEPAGRSHGGASAWLPSSELLLQW